MNKNKFRLLAAFFLMLFIASCVKDSDTTPNTTGTDNRGALEGSWLCKETCTGRPTTQFTVVVKKSPQYASDILMYNFNNLGSSTFINVIVSAASFSIPMQVTASGDSITGSGSLVSSSRIELNYTIRDGIQTDQCTAVFTK